MTSSEHVTPESGDSPTGSTSVSANRPGSIYLWSVAVVTAGLVGWFVVLLASLVGGSISLTSFYELAFYMGTEEQLNAVSAVFVLLILASSVFGVRFAVKALKAKMVRRAITLIAVMLVAPALVLGTGTAVVNGGGAVGVARETAHGLRADKNGQNIIVLYSGTTKFAVWAMLEDMEGSHSMDALMGIPSQIVEPDVTTEMAVEGTPGNYALNTYMFDVKGNKRGELISSKPFAEDKHALLMQRILINLQLPESRQQVGEVVSAVGLPAMDAIREYVKVEFSVSGHTVQMAIPGHPEANRSWDFPNVSEKSLLAILQRTGLVSHDLVRPENVNPVLPNIQDTTSKK